MIASHRSSLVGCHHWTRFTDADLLNPLGGSDATPTPVNHSQTNQWLYKADYVISLLQERRRLRCGYWYAVFNATIPTSQLHKTTQRCEHFQRSGYIDNGHRHSLSTSFKFNSTVLFVSLDWVAGTDTTVLVSPFFVNTRWVGLADPEV